MYTRHVLAVGFDGFLLQGAKLQNSHGAGEMAGESSRVA